MRLVPFKGSEITAYVSKRPGNGCLFYFTQVHVLTPVVVFSRAKRGRAALFFPSILILTCGNSAPYHMDCVNMNPVLCVLVPGKEFSACWTHHSHTSPPPPSTQSNGWFLFIFILFLSFVALGSFSCLFVCNRSTNGKFVHANLTACGYLN